MSSSFFSRQGVSRSVASVLAVVVAVLVLTVVFAVGCGKPGLVGTWYNADQDVTIEFTADGKVVSEEFGGVKPDYKTDNGTMTVTLGGQVFLSATYVVDDDSLVITDSDTGEVTTFTRQKSGATGGVVTSASDVLSVDPALVGTWYSAEVGETLEFKGDGLVISSYDSEEGVLELVYSADGSLLTISDGTDTFEAQYSIESDVLTMIDPETGDPAVYQRVQ